MSFDLGVWCEAVRPSRAAALATYARLCEGDAAAVMPSAEVTAFHAALASLPELDVSGDASAGHVLVSMSWRRVDELAPRVVALAGRHGLVCFDPQATVVHVPPALRARRALELQSCAGLTVADPDPETVERAIARLSADSWFVILEDVPGRYLQVGVGDRAGASEGGYALEFRDGSFESHVRCVLADRGLVASMFAGFHRDPAARPAGVDWQSMWG